MNWFRATIYMGFIVISILVLKPQTTIAQSQLHQIIATAGFVDVAWSPDGSYVAAAGDDGINIYDNNLEEIAHLVGQKDNLVTQITWSPDSQYLASIGLNDPDTIIWEKNESDEAFFLSRTLPNNSDFDSTWAVAWSPDGTKLAVLLAEQPPGYAGFVGITEVWNTQTWIVETTFSQLHPFPVSILTWSPDSTQLASAASVCVNDAFISCDLPYFYINSIQENEVVYQSDFYLDTVHAISWSTNNQLAIADETVTYVFDSVSHQLVSRVDNKTPGGYGILELDWNPAGTDLITGNFYSGLVEVIDIPTNIVRLQFSTGGFNAIDLSPDGNQLVTVNRPDRTIEIWDISQLVELSDMPTLTPFPTATPTGVL